MRVGSEARCYHGQGGYCGNGVIDEGEACDGEDFAGRTCLDYGYFRGSLSCRNCERIDDSTCYSTCGNGTREEYELCEGEDLGGHSCAVYGFHEGTLVCNATCDGFDTSSCGKYCGDGVVNGEELCDGLDQRGQSCADFGYAGGNLDCTAFCERSFRRCLPLEWQPEPSPTQAVLLHLWANSPDDIFAVGAEESVTEQYVPVIIHYDGVAWSPMDIPAGAAMLLEGLWGSGPSDVYASGTDAKNAVLLHYDGATWSPIELGEIAAGPPGGMRVFTCIWGRNANDVFVARYDYGTPGATQILHFDGANWSVDDYVHSAQAVSLTGDEEGRLFVTKTDYGLDVFEGGVWTTIYPELTSVLFDVEAASGVVAVGSKGIVIERAPGSDGEWSLSDTLKPATLRGLWGSQGTWFAVTLEGQIFRRTPFDNGAWHESPSSNVMALYDVAGTTTTNLFAVGDNGRILRSAGLSWHAVECPLDEGSCPEADMEATSVWASPDDNVFAVYEDRLIRIAKDGGWHVQDLPAHTRLGYVWGRAADDVFTLSVPMGDGLLHYDGNAEGTWEQFHTTKPLSRLHGNQAAPLYATEADSGRIYRQTGTSWDSPWELVYTGETASSSSDEFVALWVSPEGDVFVAGQTPIQEGLITHFDGSAWTRTVLAPHQVVNALWGSSRSDVHAAATNGDLLHYNGESWRILPKAVGDEPTTLWGRSHRDVFIGGDHGALWHYDGVAWTPMVSGTKNDVLSLTGRGTVETFASGENRTLLRFAADFPKLPGGLCEDPLPIYCAPPTAPATYHGSTMGGPSRFTSCGCSTSEAPGPEAYYRLASPVSGDISLTLDPRGADLRLTVVETDARGGCLCDQSSTSSCVAHVETGDPRELTFHAIRGRTYMLIVDGTQAAGSTFMLEITCGRPTDL